MIAMTLTLAPSLIATLSLMASEPPQAGRYTLSVQSLECQVRLNPSTAPLPESNLLSSDAAGLALVMPGCPGSLSDAIFWRFDSESGTLSLFDGSGSAVFAGQPVEADWHGQTSDGIPATLSRS